ncbi:hypothetical protein TUM4433_32290 [Shewanella schlegeliana]|nr:hypothetical protein TUM4433_32290 [Shewanella schlegeliana]
MTWMSSQSLQGLYLQRLAAVSAHTPLEAIDNYEAKTYNILPRSYCLEKNVISLHSKANQL